MSATIEIKKCCLTCIHANRKDLHPHAASFQVMCECPENPEQDRVHLARDFCFDKYYAQISLSDLFYDLKEILEYHNDNFDLVIDGTKAVIEDKPFYHGGVRVENTLEFTIAELEDIKNGFGRSLGLLQFFLAECLTKSTPTLHERAKDLIGIK